MLELGDVIYVWVLRELEKKNGEKNKNVGEPC